MPAEPAPRFRIGEVPPLAKGFTDRPDTAHGIADILVPGSAVALVPTSPPADGPGERTLGPDHPHTLAAAEWIADIRCGQR
jgi:hypothetical protein